MLRVFKEGVRLQYVMPLHRGSIDSNLASSFRNKKMISNIFPDGLCLFGFTADARKKYMYTNTDM